MSSATTVAPRSRGRLDALDGVRTIAVFLVVLFHIAVPGMGAGFIGVDIFFVLSGYLITTGLVRQLETRGRVDLVQFWSRRLRRLMPAAMLVLVAVLVWAWCFAPAYRRPALGGDLFHTVAYLANWHFMQAGSYFSSDGTQSPLLHMWSLAVEEQFYVVWPLVITLVLGISTAAWKMRRLRREAVGAELGRRSLPLLAVVSLVLLAASALALWLVWSPAAPDRAYMGTDTKAFEPLLGALLALLAAHASVRALLERAARWIGWVSVVALVGLFGTMTGPSSFYFHGGALLFCLATAGLVGAVTRDEQWGVARALGCAPMAYLGRISYGIYLWHWPLAIWLDAHAHFVWWRALLVVAATVAIASFSYHCYEQPILTGRLSRWFSAPRTYLVAALTMALVLVAAAPLGGSPLSRTALEVLPARQLNQKTWLVVGDSVPQRLMPSLSAVGAQRGLSIVSTTAGGCSPLGVHQVISEHDTSGATCPSIIAMQNLGLEQANPGTVVWWSRYEIADRYAGGQLLSPPGQAFWDAQLADFRTAVNRLTAHGAKPVVILTESPGIGMRTRCSHSVCAPILARMVADDSYRVTWNRIVAAEAARDPRIRTMTLNDAICTHPAVPGPTWGSALCDDTVVPGRVARPDGTHFDLDLVGARISATLIDRVQQALA